MQFKKIHIIVSKTDPAGLNISEHLKNNFNFKETEKTFDSNSIYSNGEMNLVFIEKRQVFADYVNELDADLFVFASKHSSESKKPTLSVHPIGNFSSAELGGKEKTLISTSALVMKNFFLNLLKKAKEKSLNWSILLEQTHHGPFLSKPAVYIEIGSSEEQWKNQIAGEILAETIMHSFSQFNSGFKTALGVGGTHYCPEFSKIEQRTGIALSHILSKYYVDSVDLSLFRQMIENTLEKIDFVLFDWKGINAKPRDKIISFCKELSLEYKRTRDFL